MGKRWPEHSHYWIIDEYNVGRCKLCLAVKDFDALLRRDRAARKEFLYDIIHEKNKRGGMKRGRPQAGQLAWD